MNKVMQHTIFQYRKKRKTNPHQEHYIYIPIPLIVLFVGVLLGVFIFAFASLFDASAHISPKDLAIVPTLPTMQSKLALPTPLPTLHPFLAAVQASKSATAIAHGQPHSFLHVPIAKAQETTPENDFCLNVRVLLYHHIQPLAIAKEEGHAQLTVDSSYFDQQMAYLSASGYHTISAEDLITALTHHTGLPAKSVVVTIDDGYDDNFTYGYQIMKKYNITGNFFIITGLLGNSGYMTWDQLKDISGNPLMHIYNHTWSHPPLASASKSKIEYEVTTANSQLESTLGKHVDIFAYPYGSFSPLAISVLQEHGFTGAYSTIGGQLQCESYIYVLRRDHIGNAPMSEYGF